MAQFFGMTFVLYLLGSAVLVPVVGFSMWQERVKCEAKYETSCSWQITPKHADTKEGG